MTIERQRQNAKQAGRVGRRVGIAVFWAIAVYVVGASAFSIIPSLYFPTLAPKLRSAAAVSCHVELDALERELSAHGAELLSQRALQNPEPWLREWDRRIAKLEGTCGPLEGTRDDLASTRTSLGTLLESYRGEVAPAQRKIRAALDALARAPHPPAPG